MMLTTGDRPGGKSRGHDRADALLATSHEQSPCFPLPFESVPGYRAATLPRTRRIKRCPKKPDGRIIRGRSKHFAPNAPCCRLGNKLRTAPKTLVRSVPCPPLDNTRTPTLAPHHSSRACCTSVSAGRHGFSCSRESICQRLEAAKATKAGYF